MPQKSDKDIKFYKFFIDKGWAKNWGLCWAYIFLTEKNEKMRRRESA